jgi:hypothetical protein
MCLSASVGHFTGQVEKRVCDTGSHRWWGRHMHRNPLCAAWHVPVSLSRTRGLPAASEYHNSDAYLPASLDDQQQAHLDRRSRGVSHKSGGQR